MTGESLCILYLGFSWSYCTVFALMFNTFNQNLPKRRAKFCHGDAPKKAFHQATKNMSRAAASELVAWLRIKNPPCIRVKLVHKELQISDKNSRSWIQLSPCKKRWMFHPIQHRYWVCRVFGIIKPHESLLGSACCTEGGSSSNKHTKICIYI